MEHDAQVLYRILSGKIRVDYNGFPYIIHNPSIEDKFVAEEIYNNSLRKLKFLGVLSRDQIIQSMSYRGPDRDWETIIVNPYFPRKNSV